MGAIAASACALLGMSGATAAAAAPLRVTISDRLAVRTGTGHPAPAIAHDFVGVSMDWCSIGTYTKRGGTAVLAHLLTGLDPERPDIRVGGDGTDDICRGRHARGPTRAEAGAVAALARAVHARLILGINMKADSRALARRQSRLLLNALRRAHELGDIQAIEIGNEPDRYHRYGNPLPQPELGRYITRYLHNFASWARIARRAFGDPTLPVAGPSLGRYGMPWISGIDAGNFARFVSGSARPALITFHAYPLLGSARCPSRLCGSLADLLLERSSDGLATRVAPYVGLAHGRPVRIDEMNSITSGGVAGASNTFGSALWAADALFEFARAGVQGVNVHTFTDARYALFGHLPGAWRVHPEYYGLLLFARAAPSGSRLLRVDPRVAGPAAGGDLKVWATRGPDGHTRIAIINKQPVTRTVVLRGPGVPAAPTVTLTRLTAAGALYPAAGCPRPYVHTGVCATGGIALGGRTFGPSTGGGIGGDETHTGVLGPAAAGTCVLLTLCAGQPPYAPRQTITVTVSAGSAALLSGLTPPRRRPTR